jgi:hypothetical protein
MKKVFIISAVFLVVVLIFLGIYNFAFKKEIPQQTVATPIIEPVTTPVTQGKAEKITAISEGAVLGLIVDKKTEELTYYDALTGLVWKMDAQGKGKKQITSSKVLGLKNVLWSPDQSKVLTTILKDGKDYFYEYDYTLKRAVTFSDGFDTVSWDNIGSKIFYKYYDATAQKATLNVANPDGSDWQKIADIGVRNLSISSVPLTSLVSYWNFPKASEETHLQMVGVSGGEPKTILQGKYGADYLWAPNGEKALVSSLLDKNKNNMTLGIVSVNGEYQELGIPTVVSKTVWSQDSKTVYYALAGGIPDGSVMPDDYQANKFNTKDTFWKIDIATGEKTRIVEIAELTGEFDASKMLLSPTEDALYFVNKVDKKLYRIQL